MSLILIVDDVAAMRQQYAYDLKRLGGHETVTAADADKGLDVLAREPVDCVILDLEMPGRDGFAFLREHQQKGLTVPVIVYTGTGSYDRCVRAVKLGAYGFLAKEEPLERVVQEVDNALQWARLTREVKQLRRSVGHDSPLIGKSTAMRALKEQIGRLAPIPSPVLILGESGSGKELVARLLHDESTRRHGPFVTVNCAALPDNLTESELFGHERGAFTGADRTRRGAFENAAHGTLFLDEVGELPVAAQAKLLRVLEANTITRIGAAREIAVDARVVAATNRDLDAEVAGSRFREDLLFRLNVHVLRVPPLRERLDDVPLLGEHLLTATCAKFGGHPKRFASEVIAQLTAHDWARNNVRELRNVIERLVIASDGDVITLAAMPALVDGRTASKAAAAPGRTAAPDNAAPGHTAAPLTLKEAKTAAELQIILAALERNGWHITNTASELGLADHSSLLKIMRRHGLRK